MRLAFQTMTAILVGMGALYAGIVNFLSPGDALQAYYGMNVEELSPDFRLAVESQIRLLAGLWIIAGVAALVCLKEFEKHYCVFRLVIAGLALSSIGELSTAVVLKAPVVPALLKSAFQLVVYLSLELWRAHLTKKAPLVQPLIDSANDPD